MPSAPHALFRFKDLQTVLTSFGVKHSILTFGGLFFIHTISDATILFTSLSNFLSVQFSLGV